MIKTLAIVLLCSCADDVIVKAPPCHVACDAGIYCEPDGPDALRCNCGTERNADVCTIDRVGNPCAAVECDVLWCEEIQACVCREIVGDAFVCPS